MIGRAKYLMTRKQATLFNCVFSDATMLQIFKLLTTRMLIISVLLAVGCNSQQFPSKRKESLLQGYEFLSTADRVKADSILTVGLDQEALYTLAARLKPVSSIGQSIRYALGKDSTRHDGDREVIRPELDSVQGMLAELQQWQRITKSLSSGDLKFLIIPFKNVYKGQRYMELLVCRQSLLDSVIQVHQSFFGQWGFVPGVDPYALLTTIEFEEKHDRYRAYGYLFGYPEYAVDFFVEASKTNVITGKFVSRSFFQIPTFSKPEGHFTYAIPKDHRPTEIDSALYRKAATVLSVYKENRQQFTRNGRLDAIALMRQNYK
jgi:hypothetical protein